jgi:hypothetical protein
LGNLISHVAGEKMTQGDGFAKGAGGKKIRGNCFAKGAGGKKIRGEGVMNTARRNVSRGALTAKNPMRRGRRGRRQKKFKKK